MRSSGPIISLEGELGTTLSLELLGRAYPSYHVHYFQLAIDFRLLS